MLVHQLFDDALARTPEKCALVFEGRRLSYRQLHRLSDALAVLLQRNGLRRGDRVAVMLENSAEFVVSLIGILKAGGVLMPVNPLTRPAKLAYLLQDAEAVALIAQRSLAECFEPALARSAALRLCVVVGGSEGLSAAPLYLPFPDETDPEGRAPLPAHSIDQDLASLIYTSGSTGEPKGVMLTHANMVAAVRSVLGYLPLQEDDVVFSVLPMAFSYGLYQAILCLTVGCRLVLERSFAFPAQALALMIGERATVFPGVPSIFAILTGLHSLQDHALGTVRILTSAAAALPVETIARLRRAFPNARIFSMYGMTECKRISFLPPEDIDVRPASVGKGMPNQDHWLVDDQGCRLAGPAVGELVVRGSHVMLGYWKKPLQTAQRLRPGMLPGQSVLHTGDLFRQDADGYLYFVARKDDIIMTRGEKVSPREVEDALHELDGVLEAAVIGVPDPILGQAVKAFVVLKPGCAYEKRSVVRHCLGRLEAYMVPKHVEFVPDLPKTDSGKIRKIDLS